MLPIAPATRGGPQDQTEELEELKAQCRKHEEHAAAQAHAFKTYVEEAERHATDLLMQMVGLHHEVQELKQERTGLGHKVASLSAALAGNADCNRRLLQENRVLQARCEGLGRQCVKARCLFQKLRGQWTRTGSGAYVLEGEGAGAVVEEAGQFDATAKHAIAQALQAMAGRQAQRRPRKLRFASSSSTGDGKHAPPTPTGAVSMAWSAWEDGRGFGEGSKGSGVGSVVHGAGEVKTAGWRCEDEGAAWTGDQRVPFKGTPPFPPSPPPGVDEDAGREENEEEVTVLLQRYYCCDASTDDGPFVVAADGEAGYSASSSPVSPPPWSGRRLDTPAVDSPRAGLASQAQNDEQDAEGEELLQDLLVVSQRQRSMIQQAHGAGQGLQARLLHLEDALAHKDLQVQELVERNQRLRQEVAALHDGLTRSRQQCRDLLLLIHHGAGTTTLPRAAEADKAGGPWGLGDVTRLLGGGGGQLGGETAGLSPEDLVALVLAQRRGGGVAGQQTGPGQREGQEAAVQQEQEQQQCKMM